MDDNIVETAKAFFPAVAAQARADEVNPRLSQHQAAELLGISVSTLLRWRNQGKGPKGFKIGGRLKYRLSEIRNYISTCEQTSLSGEGK